MAKIKPLNQILEDDCCKLLLKQTFIANVLLSLKIEVNNDFETAATDGEKIYINEKFYRSLKQGEREFVLAHETWHVILLHFARRQNRDPHYFNIAADLEIHFQLLSCRFHEPFVLPHDPKWATLSAEEIYDIIVKERLFKSDQGRESSDDSRKEQQPSPEGGRKFYSPDADRKWFRRAGGEGFDEHIYDSDSKTRERCDRIREIIHRTMQRTGYSFGSLPAGARILLENLLKPQVNWRMELKQFVTQCFGGSRRWLPPARRYVSQGMYLPSRRDAKLNAVIAVDTSGSTTRYLPEFFTELNSLLHSFGSFEITVIQCDVKIQKVEKFTDSVPTSFECFGLGGTSLIPPFEYVKENRMTPSVFIYITDGFGPVPPNPPPYPVLWLLTQDENRDFVHWGRKIQLEKEQKGSA